MSSQASYDTDMMSSAQDSSLTVIRTIVLLFLLVISLVGNSLLVFAIAVSSKRRQNPFNAYLLSMAAFGLLECSLTMSLATGFSLEGAWMFGTFLKGFNACFIQLQNIGVLLTLTAMTVDRYLSMVWKKKYHEESSMHRANYTVLYTWIHAFLISLPLLFHNEDLKLTVRDYVERSLCALSEETTIIYSIILVGTSYIMPFLVAIIYFIIVFLKSGKERTEMKKQNTANYASYCLQESQLLAQAQCAKLVFTLFLLYLVFKVPYICIDLLTQFGVDGAYIPLNLSHTADATAASGANKFYYQTAISWLMFCFSALFPIVTFTWFADHRKRVRMHLCCGKQRVPIRSSRATREGHLRQTRRFQERNRIKNRTYRGVSGVTGNNRSKIKNAPSNVSSISNAKDKVANSKGNGENGPSYRVPVLYAAADGLHLLASNKSNKDSLLKVNANNESSTTGAQGITQPASSGTKSDSEFSSSKSSSGQKTPKNWLTLNPGELLKRFKKNNSSHPHFNNDDSTSKNNTQTENATQRPSSVVDTRVDVRGSTDCLQSEEERYFKYASSDFDDDTESELNESANSRTLILPNRRLATAPVKKSRRSRAAAISPLPLIKGSKTGFLENNETEQVEVHRSASLEELQMRSESPLQNENSTVASAKDLENTYRMFSSNLALQQTSDDITSMRSFGSLHSVRFESDSVRSTSPQQNNKEKIFVRTREQIQEVNKNIDTSSRLHTPLEDVPSSPSIKSLKKFFNRTDSTRTIITSPSSSRPSSASSTHLNTKFPPLSNNIKNCLTNQKYR